MSIIYDPKAYSKKLFSEKKIKSLLKKNLTLKKTALSVVDKFDILNKKDITDVALKTIKGYKERIKLDPEIESEILKNPAQLIQRVQNEVVWQVKESIKESYRGEQYVWLPSDAEEPDPEHQLNYGKTFTIGEGEMPNDRYGCRCGMEILVKESELNL